MIEFKPDLAIVIGISDYSAAVGPLTTPSSDARAVARLLEERYKYDVICLLDEKAYGRRILAALRRAQRRLNSDSRLLFYFAGHGQAHSAEGDLEGPQGYLVPHGATVAAETHLPMADVYGLLAAIPCRHQLVVLDCCFAGAFRWAAVRPLVAADEVLYEERFRHLLRHPAHHVLTSTAHDQFAFDSAENRRGRHGEHSPFAGALLDGLEGAADRYPDGGDGVITLAELYAFLQERLIPHQTPRVLPLPRHRAGEFLFVPKHREPSLRRAQDEVTLDPGLNPYRGLTAYGPDDADRFFGRDAEIAELQSRVERRPLTVVAGPSGSGKSSLVAAGLLPKLRASNQPDTPSPWCCPAPWRPTREPFGRLAEVLAELSPPGPSASALATDPAALASWSGEWASANPGARLLLIIDQLEELITLAPATDRDPLQKTENKAADAGLPETAQRFLEALATALRKAATHDALRVLVTIRTDFDPPLAAGPLSETWWQDRFGFGTLGREALRQVIVEPARSRVLFFESPRLVDALVDETIDMPGGLALLSYTLEELYLRYLDSGRGDREIGWQEYRLVGGMTGRKATDSPTESEGPDHRAVGAVARAIGNRADAAYEGLDLDSREVLEKVLLRMVTLRGSERTRRTVPEAELTYPTEDESRRARDVVELLASDKYRLVIWGAEPSPDGAPRKTIEPAHDKLLTAWARFSQWIDAAAAELPFQRRLTEAADEWHRHPQRDPGLLWDDHPRLSELVVNKDRKDSPLNAAEAAFVAASEAERRRRVRFRWAAFSTLLALSVLVSVFFFFQNKTSEQRRREAITQSLTNQVLIERDAGSAHRALLLAVQAYRLNRGDEGRLRARVDRALRQALGSSMPARRVFSTTDKKIEAVAVSPRDGSLVLAVGEDIVWVDAGGERAYRLATPARIRDLELSPDATHVVYSRSDGQLCWRALPIPTETGGCIPLPGYDQAAIDVELGLGQALLTFSTTDTLVTSVSSSTSTVLALVEWRPEAPTAARVQESWKVPVAVQSLAVGPRYLFAGDSWGASHLWELDAPDLAATWQTIQRQSTFRVGALAASPDERWLAAGGDLGRIEIRSATDPLGEAPVILDRSPLTPVDSTVRGLAFHPESRDLVSSHDDGSLTWWRLRGDRWVAARTFSSFGDHATDVSFDAAGSSLVALTTSEDGRNAVRVWPQGSRWDLARTPESTRFEPTDEITAVAFHPTNPMRMTVGFADGRLEIWDRETGLTVGSLPGHSGRVLTLDHSSDGRWLASASEDLLTLVHDLPNATVEPRSLDGLDVAIGARDRWLATLSKRDPDLDRLHLVKLSGESAPISVPVTGSRDATSVAVHPTRPIVAVGGMFRLDWFQLLGEDSAAPGVWEGREITQLEHFILDVEFSPDGRWLASAGGDDRRGFVWLRSLGSPHGDVLTLEVPDHDVLALRFDGTHTDGTSRWLAALDRGGATHIWRLDALEDDPVVLGQRLSRALPAAPLAPTRLGHRLLAFDLALNEQQLTATDLDDRLNVWSLGLTELADRVCKVADTNLSWSEWRRFVAEDLRYQVACPGRSQPPDLLTRADTAAVLGEYGRAYGLYRTLIQEGDLTEDPAARVEALQTALRLFSFARRGRLDWALPLLHKMELQGQGHLVGLSSWQLLCSTAFNRDRPHLALTLCTRALDLSPNDREIRDIRLRARLTLDDLIAARDDVEVLLEAADEEDAPTYQRWLDLLDSGRNPLHDLAPQEEDVPEMLVFPEPEPILVEEIELENFTQGDPE